MLDTVHYYCSNTCIFKYAMNCKQIAFECVKYAGIMSSMIYTHMCDFTAYRVFVF
jgi:hypothetical protein